MSEMLIKMKTNEEKESWINDRSRTFDELSVILNFLNRVRAHQSIMKLSETRLEENSPFNLDRLSKQYSLDLFPPDVCKWISGRVRFAIKVLVLSDDPPTPTQ